MKLKRYRTTLLAVATLVGSIAIVPTADAQLSGIHPSFYGSAEWATDDTEFYLLGMYVGVGKLGWSPYFNITAFRLDYIDRRPDPLGGPREISGISPTLGLAYAGRNGGFSFGAGYTWTDFEDPGAPAEGGASSGPHVAFGAYRNGSGDRPLRLQFLSNYNFDAQYLWTRLRGSVPVTNRVHLGAEFVGEGGFQEGSEISIFKVGPTLHIDWTDNFRTGAVVGWKTSGGDRFIDGRENATYFKLEFSFSPF